MADPWMLHLHCQANAVSKTALEATSSIQIRRSSCICAHDLHEESGVSHRVVILPFVASLLLHVHELCESGTTQVIFSLKPVAVSAAACSTSRHCVGPCGPKLARRNGGILANGERQLSISR